MKKNAGLLVGLITVGCLMVFAAAVGLLIQSGAFNFTAASPSGPPRVGAPVADFTLQEVDGRTIRLSDFRGRPVLVNFWATWCPPCVAEMPLLNDFFLENEASGFMILAINTGEPVREAESFAVERNLAFHVLTDPNGSLSAQWSIHSFPTSIIVGADGVVKSIHVGMFTPEQLSDELLPILKP